MDFIIVCSQNNLESFLKMLVVGFLFEGVENNVLVFDI